MPRYRRSSAPAGASCRPVPAARSGISTPVSSTSTHDPDRMTALPPAAVTDPSTNTPWSVRSMTTSPPSSSSTFWATVWLLPTTRRHLAVTGCIVVASCGRERRLGGAAVDVERGEVVGRGLDAVVEDGDELDRDVEAVPGQLDHAGNPHLP